MTQCHYIQTSNNETAAINTNNYDIQRLLFRTITNKEVNSDINYTQK